MDTKIYINDKLAERWRELAMKRFGYGRGSISKAAEEVQACNGRIIQPSHRY